MMIKSTFSKEGMESNNELTTNLMPIGCQSELKLTFVFADHSERSESTQGSKATYEADSLVSKRVHDPVED